ncbi:MAG: hypothetical protein JSR91_27235 [Proteobacteria bacterium]|nr:hypothetical protein [Pseudomonadota bacterium]
MPAVAIEGTADESAAPGDFHARIIGGTLVLPEEVAGPLRRQGVRTAEDLVSYLQAFPSSVADALHWSVGDVRRATQNLKETLRGHIGEEHLDPTSRPNLPTGARDPDDLP